MGNTIVQHIIKCAIDTKDRTIAPEKGIIACVAGDYGSTFKRGVSYIAIGY